MNNPVAPPAVNVKVERVFGECEINIPDGFKEEVFNYIEKRESTQRLEKAINRSQENEERGTNDEVIPYLL